MRKFKSDSAWRMSHSSSVVQQESTSPLLAVLIVLVVGVVGYYGIGQRYQVENDAGPRAMWSPSFSKILQHGFEVSSVEDGIVEYAASSEQAQSSIAIPEEAFPWLEIVYRADDVLQVYRRVVDSHVLAIESGEERAVFGRATRTGDCHFVIDNAELAIRCADEKVLRRQYKKIELISVRHPVIH